MSNKGPSWLGIGAQRCGTTWFTDLLVQHPYMDVAGGQKEHHWLYRFGLTRDWTGSDREDYWASFRSHGVRLGEFTPYYLRASWICELTADALPEDCPILVLVRDPIDRFASALRREMELAAGRYRKYSKAIGKSDSRANEGRRGGMRMSVGAPKRLGRKDLLSRVGLVTSILSGQEEPQEPPEAYHDPTWLRFVGSDATWGGMYAAQLDAWTDVLPEDRFIVIQYEKLRQDPKHYTELVWKRLGLDPVPLTGIDRRSKSSTKDAKWLPEDHPHVVRSLQQMYREDARRLASRFDIDLGLWKRTMS